MRRLLGPAALLAGLSACSPAYVYKAWRGQARILSSRRPIDKVVADPAAPAALKDKLKLVEDIRRFAFDRMGLPPSKNYTQYATVPGEAVSWVATASRKTRFEAKTWWFPFIGRVPYKGYFDRLDARKEGAALEAEGWDAYVGGVSAYSTLRWFRDPVLSTMVDLPPGELAELLLHELTHTAIFFKGQADFNEALATFFGREGAREFLAGRFGADSPELADYRKGLAEDEERSLLMEELYAELDTLYSGPASDAEKLERREEVFARWKPRLGLRILNNAVVLAHRRYHFELGDFAAAFERSGRDWRKMLMMMNGLDPRQPRKALQAMGG